MSLPNSPLASRPNGSNTYFDHGPPSDILTTASLLPKISACFLIRFDNRIGYTIAWKRALDGLELEGIVEFKALPSGSHNVKEDCVYFTHPTQPHAGLAAFQNAPAAISDRNASFVSVGVLVRLEGGRLGRVWEHTRNLRHLAAELLKDLRDTGRLEAYWEQWRSKENDQEDGDKEQETEEEDEEGHDDEDPHPPQQPHTLTHPQTPPTTSFAKSPSLSRKKRRRNRAMSESVALTAPQKSLSPFHPILAIPNLLDALGPLLFPLYRACLLRKRVLLIAKPPLLKICNYVYGLSILSGIPLSLAEAVPSRLTRMRTLFNAGIHDIPALEKLSKAHGYRDDPANDSEGQGDYDAESSGWIACTSDSLLATKHALYDVMIEFPGAGTGPSSASTNTTNPNNSSWPTMSTSPATSNAQTTEATVVKATQRDVRRWRTLRQGLMRFSQAQSLTRNKSSLKPESNDENAPLTSGRYTDSPTTSPTTETAPLIQIASATSDDTSHLQAHDIAHSPDRSPDPITEPLPLAALFYSSWLWYASAGSAVLSPTEQSELEQDTDLLHTASSVFSNAANISQPNPRPGTSSSTRSGAGAGADVGDSPASSKAVGAAEMATVAYFHRLTAMTFGALVDAIDASADATTSADVDLDGAAAEPYTDDPPATSYDGGEGGAHEPAGAESGARVGKGEAEPPPRVVLTKNDIARMGLDEWSAGDRAFAAELGRVYFGVEVEVAGASVECCGVRIY